MTYIGNEMADYFNFKLKDGKEVRLEIDPMFKTPEYRGHLDSALEYLPKVEMKQPFGADVTYYFGNIRDIHVTALPLLSALLSVRSRETLMESYYEDFFPLEDPNDEQTLDVFHAVLSLQHAKIAFIKFENEQRAAKRFYTHWEMIKRCPKFIVDGYWVDFDKNDSIPMTEEEVMMVKGMMDFTMTLKEAIEKGQEKMKIQKAEA